MNTTLRQAIEEAVRRNMPQHTIQGILKKSDPTASAGKLKRHQIEGRILNKVFFVCVLYSDKYVTDRMQIATLFRKCGVTACDTRHLFTEKGFINCVMATAVEDAPLTEAQLVEMATDAAIECGAEEVEVIDHRQRHLLVIRRRRHKFGLSSEEALTIISTLFFFLVYLRSNGHRKNSPEINSAWWLQH